MTVITSSGDALISPSPETRQPCFSHARPVATTAPLCATALSSTSSATRERCCSALAQQGAPVAARV